jgi:hypothetical protein
MIICEFCHTSAIIIIKPQNVRKAEIPIPVGKSSYVTGHSFSGFSRPLRHVQISGAERPLTQRLFQEERRIKNAAAKT